VTCIHHSSNITSTQFSLPFHIVGLVLLLSNWPFFTCTLKENLFLSATNRIYRDSSDKGRMPKVLGCVEVAVRNELHRVSKNVAPLACYNSDAHEWILNLFGRNVTDKVDNQKTLHYATSNNLCFCTTWQNALTRKSHISLNWIVLHTQCSCALSSWKKLSSVMCLIASNIC